ncbi:MAG: GtrA family protein [Candidatus Eisenbacteria bacterium]|nr:GtrA family protein [Candidatus Eisenbacteria bacterium]
MSDQGKPLIDRIVGHGTLAQFIRFCMVGGSALPVDTGILAIMTEWVHLDPRVAAIPAFLGAVTWTYTLNRFWTFKAKSRTQAPASYASFVLICSAGLFIRLLVMHLLMTYAGFGEGRLYYIASLIGILVATFWNFFGSKLISFGKIGKHKKEVPAADRS